MILHEFVSWHLYNRWFRLSGLSVTGKEDPGTSQLPKKPTGKGLKKCMYVIPIKYNTKSVVSIDNICNSTSVLPLFIFCLMVFQQFFIAAFQWFVKSRKSTSAALLAVLLPLDRMRSWAPAFNKQTGKSHAGPSHLWWPNGIIDSSKHAKWWQFVSKNIKIHYKDDLILSYLSYPCSLQIGPQKPWVSRGMGLAWWHFRSLHGRQVCNL